MKKYPKRQKLISGHRYGQLWLVIPLCIFSIFCNGCGIVGAIVILGGWFFYSIKSSKQEWENVCNKGLASIYCGKEYLENQGFRECHGSHIEELVVPTITIDMIEKYKEEIKNKKKKLEEIIVDRHNYKELVLRWEWYCRKIGNDKNIEKEMIDIYHQIENKTFKYMYDDIYNKYFAIYGHVTAYATSSYLSGIDYELYSEEYHLYEDIMKSYDNKTHIFPNDAYEKLMNGGNIYA